MNSVLVGADDLENSLHEEVIFWQEFIQRYQNEGISVVPSRAIEALRLAEQKLSFYRSRHIKNTNYKLHIH